jgi:hypothetical protein
MSDIAKIEAPVPALDGAVSDSIRQYNKATRLAQLGSILLEKVDFQVSPAALGGGDPDLKRELNVETEIMMYDSESGSCVARIRWTVVFRDKRKKVASSKANYVVVYRNLKGFPEDIIKMFIDHVGKTATYAYFRALFSQLDWSANLRSPPLPVLSFSPTPKDLRANISKKGPDDPSAAT